MRMTRRSPRLRSATLLALFFVALGATGCGEERDAVHVPAPVEPARIIVEEQLPHLEEVMLDAARETAMRQSLRSYIEGEALEDGKDLSHAAVLERMFHRGEWEVQFTDQHTDLWGLTARGEDALDVLQDAARHGIDPATLHVDDVLDLKVELFEAGEPQPVDGGFTPTGAEVQALVTLVQSVGSTEEEGVQALVETVSRVDDRSELPEALERFRDYNLREAEHFTERAMLIAEIEFRLADGLLRYAGQLRHYNTLRVDFDELELTGGEEAIIDERLEQTLRELTETDDWGAYFHSLQPTHPQYAKLSQAAERYRKLVDAGGWQEVTPFTVRRGVSSPHAQALRIRLEAEGIDARPDDAADDFDPYVVDQTLINAIREYQRTHQFYTDGIPTEGFWRSVNISAERRLAQIELTMQRWRESYFDADPDYIMVNIPSFEAEVWTDGEQQMNFPVVVGQNRRSCSRERRQWVYTDATPVMMSTLNHIELNPYWYVPPGIERRTLRPRFEEDENYFEDMGYEEMVYEDGGRGLRQRPGPKNAMGQVKFIFPNRHNVFLHDTPDRRFFDYNLRAYSHGCVRVSKPLELAEFLLEWEGRNDIDVEEVLEKERTVQVRFHREMPVFIQYFTVWVDEGGDPHFLIDLYRKDAQQLSDDPENYFECTPRAAATPSPQQPTRAEVTTSEGNEEQRRAELSTESTGSDSDPVDGTGSQ